MPNAVKSMLAASAAMLVALSPILEQSASAQRGGRAGAARPAGAHAKPQVRSSASANINRDVNRNTNRNVNRNTNRNVNRDIDRDIDVDVDVHHDIDYDWDDHWHPVATAAAVATTAAIVRGAIYSTLPPACATVVVNGYSYYQCGGYWYQPQYVGSTVQYVVIDDPH